MSLISKALKKVQDSRQGSQEVKASDIVYLTDSPKPWPMVLMIILAFIAAAGLLVGCISLVLTMRNEESKQMKDTLLEKSITAQEKKINDVITTANKDQKSTDSQIYDLKDRLKKETSDTQAQISELRSVEDEQYSVLKDALVDDKERIGYLDQNIKSLKHSIDEISSSIQQEKVLANSAT